jgi:glucose/arabinose dehydrogenase
MAHRLSVSFYLSAIAISLNIADPIRTAAAEKASIPTGKAAGEYEDFVTGFVTADGKVWGRPVGIAVAKDGSLLVSEDGDKTIWRVSYIR